MQFWSRLRIALVGMVVVLAGCGGNRRADAERAAYDDAASEWLVLAEFERMPSGVAQNSAGQTFVAFPNWVEHGPGLMRDRGDFVFEPWPDEERASAFRSVNGLHMDAQDRLWVVDNGRVDLATPTAPPEVIVLDSVTGQELFRRAFDESLAPLPGAFLNDVAVFEGEGIAVFTESGLGGESALIVWDFVADVAHRALAGHESVQPDSSFPVSVNGEPVRIGPDNSGRAWLIGANCVASAGDTLVFGATSSASLWCADVAEIRDPDFSSPTRCDDHGLSDGIAIRSDIVYMTDLDAGAIAVAQPARPGAFGTVVRIMPSPGFSFPVGVEPTDRGLLVTEGQLHLMPLLHDGDDRRTPPYRLWLAPW